MRDIPIDRVRTVVRRVLSPVPEVAAAYLYGSRSRGEGSPRSDLDLAFVLSRSASRQDVLLAERLRAEIMTRLDPRVEIDAHIAEDLPLSLRGRIVTEGLLVYERDPTRRVEFETSTRRLYFDFLPFLERDAREALRAGG